MASGDARDDDALLREAQALKDRLETTRRHQRERAAESAGASARQHIADLHEGAGRIADALRAIHRFLRPVLNWRRLGWPLRAYRALWARVVYATDADGHRRLSKRRASLMLLATGFAVWMLPAFLAGTVEFFWDTGRMATSYKSGETWYLGKSQEIDPEGNVFAAQGCASIQCTDQTSIYFRIKPSMAHHVWSLIKNGNVFFPDFVAAGIQNDVNKCAVTGYGSRWKFLVRNWDIYPQILAVDCVPVTEGEILEVQRALRGDEREPPAP